MKKLLLIILVLATSEITCHSMHKHKGAGKRFYSENSRDDNPCRNQPVTPLRDFFHNQILNDYPATVKRLYRQRYTLFEQDEYGNIFVSHASFHFCPQILKYIAKTKQQTIVFKLFNWQNYAQETPLHNACTKACYAVAEVLLLYGAQASTNVQDLSGHTPLHRLILSPRKEGFKTHLLTLMLKYGADTEIRNNNGWSPRDLAQGTGQYRLLEIMNEHYQRKMQRSTTKRKNLWVDVSKKNTMTNKESDSPRTPRVTILKRPVPTSTITPPDCEIDSKEPETPTSFDEQFNDSTLKIVISMIASLKMSDYT